MTQILLVDDDPFIRMFGDALLAMPGRSILTAATGAEALAHLSKPPPNLILLDVGLPDVSGLEVLRIFRATPSWQAARILMLTASHEMEDLVQAKRAGASGYICKPVQPDVLASMVEDILEQHDLIWLDDYTRARRVP